MQKRIGANILLIIGIALVAVSIGFFIWENSLIANNSTLTMQIYNFELEAWEPITFFTANTPPPAWGITILIIGMFPLVFGLLWNLTGLEFSSSFRNS